MLVRIAGSEDTYAWATGRHRYTQIWLRFAQDAYHIRAQLRTIQTRFSGGRGKLL